MARRQRGKESASAAENTESREEVAAGRFSLSLESSDDEAPEELTFKDSKAEAQRSIKEALDTARREKEVLKEKRRRKQELFQEQKKRRLLPADVLEEIDSSKKQKLSEIKAEEEQQQQDDERVTRQKKRKLPPAKNLRGRYTVATVTDGSATSYQQLAAEDFIQSRLYGPGSCRTTSDSAATSGSAAPTSTSDFVCKSEESGSPRSHQPTESCETRPERGKSKAKVKRKYHGDYIKFGFFWTGNENDPYPLCVLCYKTLANESMKPSKLKRHFESQHKNYIGEPLELFERLRDGLKKDMKNGVKTDPTNGLQKDTANVPSQVPATGENAKATEASYRVSLLIAKTGKPHSIGESLVKEAAKVMTNVLFGEEASGEITRVPLSNDTVQRRITAMAENVKKQLIAHLGQSQFFTLQLDQSTEVGNEAILLCFVRYIYAGGVQEDFLFCCPLPTNATGEAIFDPVNKFVVRNNIDWTRCVGICTDGAAAMTATQSGLVACVRAVAPCAAETHCCIRRELLVAKNMPSCLKSVLDESVKIVNTIKTKAQDTHLCKVLCEEMGSEHTQLLFHTETRWLLRGNVLARLFELRDDVMLFLHHTHELYDRLQDFRWLSKLAYLADVFGALNASSLALRGKAATAFNVQDKMKAARLRMELWCDRLECREFDCFPALGDLLLVANEELDGGTVAAFKKHLQGLRFQLGLYFPELDSGFEWVRNPFRDQTHVEQVKSELTPRQVKSLVDVACDWTLRTAFKEKSLTDFWVHVQPAHPELADAALKLLMPFPTAYNCEVGFSALVGLKTRQRNRMNVDCDMRLNLTSFDPDIVSLMSRYRQHHASH